MLAGAHLPRLPCPPRPAPGLQAFFPRLFSRCSVEAFACGNLGPEAASDFARRLEAQLRERCAPGLWVGGAAGVLAAGAAFAPAAAPSSRWSTLLSASVSPTPPPPPCRRGAQPPFASQACEQRVVALPRGRPALLALPGPNPANENSAALVAFQVGGGGWVGGAVVTGWDSQPCCTLVAGEVESWLALCVLSDPTPAGCLLYPRRWALTTCA